MKRQRMLIAALLAVLAAVPSTALVSTSEPAALLVFPLLTVDDATGADTLIQLTNTDAAEVGVHCLYQDPAAARLVPFTIQLAGNQPAAWRAGAGLANLPNDGGSVPALGAGPFTGILRCLAVDTDGTPSDRNVLVGSATLERVGDAPAALDAAQYAATGLAAVAGAPNGDEQLVLGGESPEYAACPAALLMQVTFDGAMLELGAAGTIQRQSATTVALTTCSHTAGGTAGSNVQFRVQNEFGQAFGFGLFVTEQRVTEMSRIDTSNPNNSIFNAAVQGTNTGAVHMTPGGSALVALAVQRLADPALPADLSSAALSPHELGDRAEADIVELSAPTVPTVPTATPTVVPTSCIGDCDGNGTVTINELITGVGIALGSRPLSACPQFDGDGSATVAINELIAAVNNALTGC